MKENSALFLDIDGTLLDVARTPDAVIVPPGLISSLRLISDHLRGAVAFVSGRPLAAIDRLFAPLKFAAIGCHGAEIRGHEGAARALTEPLPATVRGIFRDLAGRHPGVILEDKTYALALHYRLAPEAKADLDEAMERHRALFAAERVFIQHGKAVIDARHVGIDKGFGVKNLSEQEPFHGRVPIFGGDDTTDIDAFQLLPKLGGSCFSVGRRLPGAKFFFPSPLAVRQWLAQLAREGVA